METKYYIISTLVTLILLLLMLSTTGCTQTQHDGIQTELPHTPLDKEGGTR